MACSDPANTLAFHSSRILCQHRDMRDVTCKVVADTMQGYRSVDGAKDTKPEAEALWFYGLNHAVALVSASHAPHEPLSPEDNALVELYHAKAGPKAVRAFYYLIWICTREARHLKDAQAKAAIMNATFGPGVGDFYVGINGGESGISDKFLKKPPPCTIGTYCDSLAWQFYKGHYSGGYGGKKWGAIADLLCKFVRGEYSAEIMLDTLFTMQHNGGSIFNKYEFYAHYDHHGELQRILDIQRSGQVPEAILTDKVCAQYADPELKHAMGLLHARFPGKLGNYVDWQKVQDLGAIGHYGSEIEAQLKAVPLTPEQIAAKAAAEALKVAQAKAAEEAKLLEAAEFKKKWLQVMPGIQVPKVQREAA